MADQKPAFQESPLTFAWIRDPGRDAMEGRMPLLGMLSSSGARIKFQGGCGCVGETTPKYYLGRAPFSLNLARHIVEPKAS